MPNKLQQIRTKERRKLGAQAARLPGGEAAVYFHP
jgi:hypothetical protein